MQQTGKYQFNLIETSDTFGPEKLNENAQKLEDALTDHENTVSAALAQHKTETTAALADKADKTTLDNLSKTVTADKTEAAANITAVEQGARLFHLAGPVSGLGVTADLSGVNISQYRALLAFVRYANYGKITVCGITVSLPHSSGSAIVWIYRTDAAIVINAQATCLVGSEYYAGSAGASGAVPWASLTSITCDSNISFMDVYGIKA